MGKADERLKAQEAFLVRTAREEDERRSARFNEIMEDYAKQNRSDFQLGWMTEAIKRCARYCYAMGRHDENAEHVAADMDRPSQFDEMS